MRAHHVKVEHTFTKPPERIFDYLAEHENLAVIFGAQVTRLKDADDGQRNGAGSVRKLKVGPAPAFEETITEFVHGKRIVYRITRGSPLKGHIGVMSFAPTASGGTKFDYDIRLAARIPGLALLVKASLTRSIEQGMAQVERDA